MEQGDSRSNKARGEGKHGYSVKEQKRIENIKAKKEAQKENQGVSTKKEKTETIDDEIKIDPQFGLKGSKKLKNKLKQQQDQSFD